MDFIAILRIAVQALTRNKMRSLLTMLGIIIGVGAVIATVGVGQGAQQQVQDQIAAMGTNVIFISSGTVNRGGVRVGSGATKTLINEDVQAILPGVAAHRLRPAHDSLRRIDVGAQLLAAVPIP